MAGHPEAGSSRGFLLVKREFFLTAVTLCSLMVGVSLVSVNKLIKRLWSQPAPFEKNPEETSVMVVRY